MLEKLLLNTSALLTDVLPFPLKRQYSMPEFKAAVRLNVPTIELLFTLCMDDVLLAYIRYKVLDNFKLRLTKVLFCMVSLAPAPVVYMAAKTPVPPVVPT